MFPIGKWLFFGGLAVAALGLVLWLAGGRGWFDWLGRLPGDIRIEKPGARIHFPIVTCLIISIVLSLFFSLLRKWWP